MVRAGLIVAVAWRTSGIACSPRQPVMTPIAAVDATDVPAAAVTASGASSADAQGRRDPPREPLAEGTGEWRGTIRTGLMAIGGETTGITLTTTDAVFELRADGALADSVNASNGREVTVRGRLRVIEGISRRRQRRIIEVTAIVTP